MSNDNQGQATPAAGSGSEGGNPPKLIAGKFKSIEEAVEQGYMGLEKGYTELGEKVGALTRILEAALEAPVPSANVRQAGTDPHGRGTPATDEEINPADFI